MTQLPQEFYDFLQELQTRLKNFIKSIGRIDHNNWRSSLREQKEIELFLVLPESKSVLIIEIN